MVGFDLSLYGQYVVDASAASTSNSTDLGSDRLTRVIGGVLFSETDLENLGLSGGFTEENIYYLTTLGETDPITKPSSNQVVSDSANQKSTSPIGYKFNLPPHQWSLPTAPNKVDPDIISNANRTLIKNNFHGLRRGRIWYWNTSGDITQIDESGNAVALGDKYSGKGNVAGGSKVVVGEDRKYAFQFLWNPETIQVNVTRNMDITPSAADSLRVVAGVFPGQETVSLSLLLDRTNDFACFKHHTKYNNAWSSDSFSKFYRATYPFPAQQSFGDELRKLMEQGTLYDLEYLFKAINGDGIVNSDGSKAQYANLLNRVTSNVGYLQPTLLAIELGPDKQNNLSYVGWISNVSMNHTKFTETMVPLQTQVNISIECFTGSGIGVAKS